MVSVFHQEEYSTQNDNFFRLLTHTLHYLHLFIYLYIQKKILVHVKKFCLVGNGRNSLDKYKHLHANLDILNCI